MTDAEGKKIVSFALSKVGLGYIMGATGWVATQSRLDQQSAQYPGSSEMIKKFGKQWIGKQCYDCAQLTKAAAKELGISIPSGATSQHNDKSIWKQGGTIDTLPRSMPGIFLYRYDSVKKLYQHTGIYCGDGTFVDASGTQYGILHRPMSKYAWTHWKMLKSKSSIIETPPKQNEGGETNMENFVGKIIAVNLSTLAQGTSKINLREAGNSSSPRLAQIGAKGRMLVLSDNNDGWLNVEYGDLTGYVMKRFVNVVDESPADQPDETEDDVPVDKILSPENFLIEVKSLVDKYFGNG